MKSFRIRLIGSLRSFSYSVEYTMNHGQNWNSVAVLNSYKEANAFMESYVANHANCKILI